MPEALCVKLAERPAGITYPHHASVTLGALAGATDVYSLVDLFPEKPERACTDFGTPDRFTDYRGMLPREDLLAVHVAPGPPSWRRRHRLAAPALTAPRTAD